MKAKKRYTTIEGFTRKPLRIDVDKWWQTLLAMPPAERVGAALSPWRITINMVGVELPDRIKNRFLDHFLDPEAEDARAVALGGLVAANHDREMGIIESARQFDRRRLAGEYAGRLEDAAGDMILFAPCFAEIVANRDVSSLRRMINILEAGGLPAGERGGIGSADGYMLEKFAELHVASRSLPTKKALRDACGLGKNEDEKISSKRMNKLGLRGLPTEPEI